MLSSVYHNSKFWMLSEIVAVVSCRHTYWKAHEDGLTEPPKQIKIKEFER